MHAHIYTDIRHQKPILNYRSKKYQPPSNDNETAQHEALLIEGEWDNSLIFSSTISIMC